MEELQSINSRVYVLNLKHCCKGFHLSPSLKNKLGSCIIIMSFLVFVLAIGCGLLSTCIRADDFNWGNVR